MSQNDEALIDYYTEIIKSQPKNMTALGSLLSLYYKYGRYEEALEAIDRLLRLNPTHIVAQNLREDVLKRLNRSSGDLIKWNLATPQLKESDKDENTDLGKKSNQNTHVQSTHPREESTPQVPAKSPSPIPPEKEGRVSVERTIYDPLARDFIVSTARPLVNVKSWIDRHDPASYWLVVCVHNHGDRTIEEWGIELNSSSSLRILDAAIEGIDGQVHLQTSNPKPWLVRSILGISHHRGIVIPRNGSRRVYFRLGSESCGVAHTIRGKFIADHTEAEIREKQFQHSCDVATLGTAMQQDPIAAERFTETVLRQRYHREIAQQFLHTFHLIQDISGCCHAKKFEDVHDKLYTLEDALEKMAASDSLIGLVQRLNALDIHDGMGGSALELKAREAERMCRNIIDLWKNEVLSAP